MESDRTFKTASIASVYTVSQVQAEIYKDKRPVQATPCLETKTTNNYTTSETAQQLPKPGTIIKVKLANLASEIVPRISSLSNFLQDFAGERVAEFQVKEITAPLLLIRNHESLLAEALMYVEADRFSKPNLSHGINSRNLVDSIESDNKDSVSLDLVRQIVDTQQILTELVRLEDEIRLAEKELKYINLEKEYIAIKEGTSYLKRLADLILPNKVENAENEIKLAKQNFENFLAQQIEVITNVIPGTIDVQNLKETVQNFHESRLKQIISANLVPKRYGLIISKKPNPQLQSLLDILEERLPNMADVGSTYFKYIGILFAMSILFRELYDSPISPLFKN